MKFLRDMISRKQPDGLEDEDNAVEEFVRPRKEHHVLDTSEDDDIYATLESIQSKLKPLETVAKPAPEPAEKTESAGSEAVDHLVDLVADMTPAQPKPAEETGARNTDDEDQRHPTARDGEARTETQPTPQPEARPVPPVAKQPSPTPKPRTQPTRPRPVPNEQRHEPTRPERNADKAPTEATSKAEPDTGAQKPAEKQAAQAPQQAREKSVAAQIRPEVRSTRPPETETRRAAPTESGLVEVPAPTGGRSSRRAGRVKTRLLGFEHSGNVGTDPFDKARQSETKSGLKFPVGWIVVTKGPGRGASFSLCNGVSNIGRGEGQAIRLDFGDISISRENHAAVAYDDERKVFFLGHGGKANLVRLNDRPVLSTEELSNGDTIRIGETTLKFVALCGKDFDWGEQTGGNGQDAAGA